MTPLTRKENYLNEIVGWGNTAPEKPLTPEEFFFAAILGEAVQVPDLSNASRYELFLAKIAGYNVNISPPTYTSPRLEFFLAKAAGMDVVTPVPLTKEEIFWANYKGIEQIIEGVPPLTFKSNGANLSNYRIYGNTENGESVGDLVTDSQSEHYGNYAIPITNNAETANIYLDEPLRKVGNEAEYVDYATQKWHRVRKNLFDENTITEGAYIDKYTGNIVTGSAASNVSDFISVVPNNTYTLSYAYIELSSSNRRVIGFYSALKEWVSLIEYSPLVNTVFNINVPNDIYYIKVTTDIKMTNVMLNSGSEPLAYEPYIEDTELDITLPALPTLSGTNTLSFETTVQPSKVMIKTGKFGTHKVRYYDSDGTFLNAEDVKDGTNAQGFTPTKASTEQYNYAFMGWNTTKGSTTAETGVLNDITADKSLYAVFSQSLRTFTVYFYNDSTLLQTAENVQYGGTATYTGEAPTKDGFTFSGWQPSNVNITADTSCYAQFVEG